MKQLLFLWRFISKYKSRYLITIGLLIIASIFSVIRPIILKDAIDSLEKGFSLDFILVCAGAIVALSLIRNLFQFYGRYGVMTNAREVEYDIRNYLYSCLQKASIPFYQQNNTGDISSRMINDLEQIRMLIGLGVVIIASAVFTFVLATICMLYINWLMTLLAFSPLLVVGIVVGLFAGKIERLHYQSEEILGKLSSFAQENFSGIKIIKSFVQEKTRARKFSDISRQYKNKNMQLTLSYGAATSLMSLIAQICIGIIILAGGIGIITGKFTKGEFVAFSVYLFMLIFPVITIGYILVMVKGAIASIKRIQLILDARPEIEPEQPQIITGIRSIKIRGLSFRYSPDREWALKDINLSIREGEKVAIVGSVGSGKSTLLNLLLKFYPVEDNKLYINDVDINKIPTSALRSFCAYLPQEISIFSDTIRNNILFGTNTSSPDASVEEVCRKANLVEDIKTFPDGYEQMLGEGGITCSGGQKQRIALARCLIRKPHLLLLDDPFSYVDTVTEENILQQLLQDTAQAIWLLSTHRFASLKNVDRIIVIENGRIVEEGDFDTLIKRGGTFASLYERQKIEQELRAIK